jgi:hypothetical protein
VNNDKGKVNEVERKKRKDQSRTSTSPVLNKPKEEVIRNKSKDNLQSKRFTVTTNEFIQLNFFKTSILGTSFQRKFSITCEIQTAISSKGEKVAHYKPNARFLKSIKINDSELISEYISDCLNTNEIIITPKRPIFPSLFQRNRQN